MLIRIITLLVFISLSTCSSIKLTYQYADWILLYKLKNYVDLTGDQKEWVETELNTLIQWHTRIELPKYILILDELKKDIQDDTIQAKWDSYRQQYRVRQTVLLEQIIGSLSDILLRISPEQLKDLRENLQEENEEEFEEKNMPVEERKEKRTERYLDNYEDWLGSLSDEQELKIKEFGSTLPLTAELHFENRIRGQELFFEIMNQKDLEYKKIKNLLTRLWITRDFEWTEKSKKIWQEINFLNKIFLTEFKNSISQHQKAYLLDQLDSTIDDFRDIIEEDRLTTAGN